MGDDTHADFGLAGTGRGGTAPKKNDDDDDDDGPTAAAAAGAAGVVAPPPPADDDDDAMEPPLSPDPPRWRFVNEAKKSLGYSSIHAGSYVRGKSSDELGARYSAQPDDISSPPRPKPGGGAHPKKVAFELPTNGPFSKKAGTDVVGKLDADVFSPGSGDVSDRRVVEVGRLHLNVASSQDGRHSPPSGYFGALPKFATGATEAREPYKEWGARVQMSPKNGDERERAWYDGNVRDSYVMPGDDDRTVKTRGDVGRLNFCGVDSDLEEFAGGVLGGRRTGGGGRGGGGETVVDRGEFDRREGALFVHPDDDSADDGKDVDDATARGAEPTTPESPKKSTTRKWICLLILILLPIVIILGVLVGVKRSAAPAGAVGSGFPPPVIVANETTTTVPSSSPSVLPSGLASPSPSAVVLGEPFSSTTSRPTSQRICSKERDFNLCIAVDMSGSVCNDGDGSDCLSCPGASFLSALFLASECRDTTVSEESCCENFAKVKEFASIMVNLLGNFPSEKSFSIVQFATDARLVATLSSADDTVSTIDGLAYTGGMTNHESAIRTCQQTLPSFDDDRKNFIMLITDGLSSVPEYDPEGAAEAAATEAKYGGSFIIPVFISPDNDLSALEFMSRLSSDGIVFDVTDFDTLSSLQDRLIDQVSCS